MTRSELLFEQAQLVMPGGVNSPVRACRSVGTYPRFLEKGLGSHVWDVDGNEYIDLICSWGPLILGHCEPHVEEAVRELDAIITAEHCKPKERMSILGE